MKQLVLNSVFVLNSVLILYFIRVTVQRLEDMDFPLHNMNSAQQEQPPLEYHYYIQYMDSWASNGIVTIAAPYPSSRIQLRFRVFFENKGVLNPVVPYDQMKLITTPLEPKGHYVIYHGDKDVVERPYYITSDDNGFFVFDMQVNDIAQSEYRFNISTLSHIMKNPIYQIIINNPYAK